MIAARIDTEKCIIIKAIMHVHRQSWTKIGGLDIKEMDHITIVFYFENMVELEVVLKKAPLSFENCLIMIQRLEQSFFSFNLVFDSKIIGPNP